MLVGGRYFHFGPATNTGKIYYVNPSLKKYKREKECGERVIEQEQEKVLHYKFSFFQLMKKQKREDGENRNQIIKIKFKKCYRTSILKRN